MTTIFCFFACLPNLLHGHPIAKSGILHTYKLLLLDQRIAMLVMIMYMISTCALMCCQMDKSVPNNYLLLLVFTFCVSWMVSVACVRTKPVVVFEAACLTFAVVFAITFYAFTTATDFTVLGPLIFVFGFVFCTAGFLFKCFGYHLGLVYSVIGVILFGFYLLFDTQMILGGDSKRYQFDEDSYILASVALYMDIINIFLYILSILNDE